MLERVESIVTDGMAEWGVPGVSIALLHDGQVETQAFGIASIATRTPVLPETLFQIGSISKVFTATLVITFVDDGEVELDTPIVEYIPELPLADTQARRQITLRHLLTHMAGFYGDRFDDQGDNDDALAKAVAAFHDLPQQTRPGELWTYCNAGFDLAGRILEVQTGRRFEELMRERVFNPLGLETTTYFAAEAIRHPVAVGHDGDPGELTISDPWPIPRRSNPAGGISSTTGQLLRFAQMQMNDGELDGTRILSAESAGAMRELQAEADAFRTWGLGWSRSEIGGEVIVQHSGATNGFCARLVAIPSRSSAFAVLTNHDDGDAVHNVLAKAALRLFYGLESPVRPVVSLPASRLKERAGTYSHGLGDLILTATADGYDVQRIHRNPFDGVEGAGKPFILRPVSETIFEASGGAAEGSYAEFILNEEGTVRFLRFGGRLAYPQSAGETTTDQTPKK